jgi:hypothetical protein
MIASLLLIGSLLAGQTQAPATDDDAVKVEVHHLVKQLNEKKAAVRDAAEAKLLAAGPQVLELLPEATDDTPAEVKNRLDRIRQKLQQRAAEAATRAALVTLKSPGMPLSKILAALEKQSGNRIIDARRQFGQTVDDPVLKVDFDHTPFWRALDEVLDQAKLAVYAFGQQRGINVVASAPGQLPRTRTASYSGPFRFEPVRILASRDLRDPASGGLMLAVDVTWEPRLRPMGLKQPMADVVAVDENGKPLPADDRKAEVESLVQSDVTGIELELPLALPPRAVQEIARFKGSLQAMVPGKIETFRFADLLTAKNVEKRIAGVTVTLEQVRKNNDLWEVRMRARFDDAGKSLESHRGWILQNEAYLEGPDKKPIPFGSQETTQQSHNEIGLAYVFSLKQPPRNLTFVYKTPGVIVTTAFPYEIKDIKLP